MGGAGRQVVDDRGDRSQSQQAEALERWGLSYWEAVHRFNPGGAYVNFMMDDEAEARVQASYGRFTPGSLK